MSQDESSPTRVKRERSTRYPGVALAESVELCQFVEGRGLDGLTAADIATSLGYKNIKTNTFSARLSAARQFGLLILKDEGYSLTPLARSILHPVDPADTPRLYRQALLEPPLYAELAEQFGDKKLPEAGILGNVALPQSSDHRVGQTIRRRGVPRLRPIRRRPGRRPRLPASGTDRDPRSPRDDARQRPCPRLVDELARSESRRGSIGQVERRPDRPPALGRRRGQGDPTPGPRGHHAGELQSPHPGAPTAPEDRRARRGRVIGRRRTP